MFSARVTPNCALCNRQRGTNVQLNHYVGFSPNKEKMFGCPNLQRRRQEKDTVRRKPHLSLTLATSGPTVCLTDKKCFFFPLSILKPITSSQTGSALVMLDVTLSVSVTTDPEALFFRQARPADFPSLHSNDECSRCYWMLTTFFS